MTANEARALFRLVLGNWPAQRQRMDDDDVTAMALMFVEGLADIEHQVARAAIARLVRTARVMPNVADIRAAIGVLEHGRKQTGMEAWAAVMAALKRHGSHRSPGVDFVFKDPITARVVSSIGWRELCVSENATADRARFIEAYTHIAALERTEAQAMPGARSAVLDRGARENAALPIGELVKTLGAK